MNPTMQQELRKFNAPEIVFGKGALDLVGRYAEHFRASRVLLVTDPGVTAAGWAARAAGALQEAGMPYVTFDRVTPNPKEFEVMAGADTYRQHACDVIVAVGGGSVMDCAKGIGAVSSNNQPVAAFEGVDEVPLPGPPLICVPTTAGSSADVSQFAIITAPARRVKFAIISKTMIPDVALIDALTTTTMSPALTAATGVDALVHAIEAYVSNASSPLTDLTALEAIRVIRLNLPLVIADPDDLAARDRMMFASMLAGLAFSNASLGLVHSMAHSLGGRLDLAHGECNALLLEYVVDFNFAAAPEKYLQVSAAMGVNASGKSASARKAAVLQGLRAFRTTLGPPQTLRDLGVTADDLPALAEVALHDPCLVTNPVMPTRQEIERCYAKALDGEIPA